MRKISLLLTALAMSVPLASPAQQAAMVEPAINTEYQIDSDASWIRVLAAPDGPLKRFGHFHVISNQAISGAVSVAPNPLDSTIMFEISVADLEVDNADLRALEGEDFEGEVPQKDIDGTRANMLGEKLLNGEQFPNIQIRSTAIEGSMPDVNIVTTVSIIGIEKTVTFPANINLSDNSFVASGQIELTHADLGLSPFTAMGGALSVHDTLVLKYEISGTEVSASE